MKTDVPAPLRKLIDKLKKGGAALVAVILLGAFLLLLPTGEKKPAEKDASAIPEEGAFSLADTEERIAGALSKISGAGRVTVVLTLKSSAETVIATDTKTTDKNRDGERDYEKSVSAVVVGSGSSVQTPVTLKRVYPEFLGALIVAEGADNAQVRLDILKAVSGLTGLGTDKIAVTKMKNS
jgi:stage III sporulation protein AG